MKKLFPCLFSSLLFTAAQAQGPRLGVDSARGLPFVSIRDGRSYQSAAIFFSNGGDSTTVTVRVKGAPDLPVGVGKGAGSVEIFVPEVKKPTTVAFTLETGGKTIGSGKVDLAPVR